VLYLVTDDQLDARRRLGISESDPDVARVQRGPGSITVVGLAGAHAVDVLYRSGPGRFGRFDAVVVDTPPVKKGGCLPGVLLIAPTDGDDASANLIRMLRATPTSTDIVLVRIDAVPKHEWVHDAAVIHGASDHTGGFSYLPSPLPRTTIVHPDTQHAFDAIPGDLEYFTLPGDFTKGCHHATWSPSGDTIACWGSGVDQAMPDGTGRQVVTAHRFSKSMDASGYWKWSWQGTLFPTPTFAKLNADLGNILPASTFRVTFHYPQYVYDEEHALVTMIVTDQPGNVLTCRAVLVYFTGVAADTIFLDITGAVEEAVRRDDPEDEREYRSVFGTATHSRQQ